MTENNECKQCEKLKEELRAIRSQNHWLKGNECDAEVDWTDDIFVGVVFSKYGDDHVEVGCIGNCQMSEQERARRMLIGACNAAADAEMGLEEVFEFIKKWWGSLDVAAKRAELKSV